MALTAISVDVDLSTINCGCCGGTYAINERYRKKKAQDGGGWTCPYCKSDWGYFDNNENSTLKKKLAKEEERRKWAEQNAAERLAELGTAERKLAAQKGVTTKLKNRAKAGVCPCCNRTFKQLAAHMKNKHPDFAREHGTRGEK